MFDNKPFLDQFCKEQGFVGWYHTSAKENVNIEEAVALLVTEVRVYIYHVS